MNLRDNFAHGFGKKKFFTREVSNRLFHIMICLSLLKKPNLARLLQYFFGDYFSGYGGYVSNPKIGEYKNGRTNNPATAPE
jgi:hypothetical protein